ncbi:MAG TPA: glycosyltransferase [Terriglobales bacterium]
MRRVVILTEIIAPYRIPVFNALARTAGIDLHVIFLSKTDTSMRQWRVYENEIKFSYEVLPGWRRRFGKYNVLLNYRLGEALSQSRPGVIVCGGYNYLASWQAMRWARRHRVRFVLWSESTAQDSRSEHLLVESLKREFLKRCTGFVVPGHAAQEYLLRLRVPPPKIFMARNAVDLKLFSNSAEAISQQADRVRAELALPDRYFLFVGRLVRAKGVLDLIEAYASLPAELRSEIGLVYVGDGPLRSELEAAARDIFPGLVHFAGFVDRDQLPAYYKLAECLVLPTHSDTWGMVINEAMACSLPVICTHVAGCAADLIKNNGRLVAPGNVTQLAAAMREIANNSDLRLRMSRESQTLIQEFSPETCAAGIAQASLALEAHV